MSKDLFENTFTGVDLFPSFTNPKTKEDIKKFLQQMKDQDNRSTAFPYFYVIRTEKEVDCNVDNADETKVYWQGDTYDSMEEVEKYCQEAEYSEEETRDALREATEYGVRKVWQKKGMFLTETDAENHLKRNHYHYSSNAHTYVDHAWRAPELEGFFKNLFEYFEVK